MELTEKVAYLKGLMDGHEIDESTKEGKVLRTILDVLDDLAMTVSDVQDNVHVLTTQVDLIDEDLEELQDDFYEDDCGCGCDDEEYFDGELYEVTCPSCNDVICIDEDMLDEGEIACPSCGEQLEFDLDGVLDECQSDSKPKKD